MRIGILTLCSGYNYGGFLQCYATHKLLEGMGHSVEEINVCLPNKSKLNSTINKLRTLNSIQELYKTITEIFHKNGKTSYSDVNSSTLLSIFDEYREQYLNLSIPLTETTIGEYANNNYDAIVVGSDQVWTDVYDSRSIYFCGWLPYFKGQKIAFAACSAHKKVDFLRRRQLKPLLESFKMITVRDNTTASLVKDIVGIEPDIIGDPSTFYDYKEFVGESPYKEPYILTYILGGEIEGGHELALKKIKDKYGKIKVISICVGHIAESLKHNSDECLSSVTPSDWVNLIANAAFVYTDSFHAILFSMKFGIPLVAYYTDLVRSSRLLYLKNEFDLKTIVNSADSIDMSTVFYVNKNSNIENLKKIFTL